MTHCQTVQEWLPWYVTGRLSPTKLDRLARHIDSCETCQQDLARIIQLRHQFVSSVEAEPAPFDRVWEALEPTLAAPLRERIDVGSFLIGLNLGITAGGTRHPIQGDLNVLGRKVRIIGKRTKGA